MGPGTADSVSDTSSRDAVCGPTHILHSHEPTGLLGIGAKLLRVCFPYRMIYKAHFFPKDLKCALPRKQEQEGLESSGLCVN